MPLVRGVSRPPPFSSSLPAPAMVSLQQTKSQEVAYQLKEIGGGTLYVHSHLSIQVLTCSYQARATQMVTQAQPRDVVDNLWSYRWLQTKQIKVQLEPH